MKINILIATIDHGLEKIKDILLEPQADVKYIVSHQYTDPERRSIPAELKREDVVVAQLPGRGISRNRNNALNLADGDVAVLADDDVRYTPENFEAIRQAFANDSKLMWPVSRSPLPPAKRSTKNICRWNLCSM